MCQCGYIGLGAMGKNMARHISNRLMELNSPSLLVFNRTSARSIELKQTSPHIEIAESLQEIGNKCKIIFSCLLNDNAVQETINQLKTRMKPGTIVVESSTIHPSLAKTLAQELKAIGVYYIACPVLGPPEKAATAELTAIISGGETKQNRDRVLSILIPSIGKKVINLDLNDVSEALKLKLCGNFFVTSIIESVAEGMTLGQAAGVGQDKVKELLDTVFPNTLFGIYAHRMLNNTYQYQVGFSISGVQKDVGHILDMAKESNVSLPITEIFLENTKKVQKEYGSEIDVSSIVTVTRRKAGLE